MTIRSELTVTVCLLASLSVHAASPEFQAAIEAEDPLLYFKFDEAPGQVPRNHGTLGNPYNGSYFGNCTLNYPTQLGDTGVFFNSVNDYIETDLAAPASLTGNPTFSIEALVYLPDDTTGVNYPTFLHWGGAATMQSVYFSLHYNDNNRLYAGFYNGGLMMTGTITQGDWHHLVMLRTGGGNALTGTKLYVNGAEVPLTSDPVLCCNSGTPAVTSTTFRINRATDLTRYFVGAMDELALYGRLLTVQEITDHYKAFRPAHVSLVQAASRRQHGPAGTFDIAVPVTGGFSLDTRQNGAKPQMVLFFDDNIEAIDGAVGCGQEITVVNGTCQAVSIAGKVMTVDMQFNRNKCVSVFVQNIRGTNGLPFLGDFGVRVYSQEGNVNGDSNVNILDLQAIKNNLNQPVSAQTFKYDITCNGSINILDLQAAKNNLNQQVTCP